MQRNPALAALALDRGELLGVARELLAVATNGGLVSFDLATQPTPPVDERFAHGGSRYSAAACCARSLPNRSAAAALESTSADHSRSRPAGVSFLNTTLGLPVCAAIGISNCET